MKNVAKITNSSRAFSLTIFNYGDTTKQPL
jgi:hypothetical protein